MGSVARCGDSGIPSIAQAYRWSKSFFLFRNATINPTPVDRRLASVVVVKGFGQISFTKGPATPGLQRSSVRIDEDLDGIVTDNRAARMTELE